MLHGKMYLQYTIFYQCNGIKYILKKHKNRIVVYLKKNNKKKDS